VDDVVRRANPAVVVAAVAASAAYDGAEVLERFAQARVRGEGAADGVHATVPPCNRRRSRPCF
jgi:hypothetical protein